MEGTPEGIAAAVRRLVDRAAIEDCLLRYFRGLDRFDVELVRSTYHADAYDDHGHFKGTASQFFDHLDALLPAFSALTHFRGNSLIEFQSEDVAHVETYALAYHRPHDQRHQDLLCVRYLDRFERRSGEWRVAHRRVVVDWSASSVPAADAEHAAEFMQGRHSTEDPVYDWSDTTAPGSKAG